MSANVLVIFYSRSGVTELLARAVADGSTAAGGVVRMRRARDIVDPNTMTQVPGWIESSARMDQAYEAPTAGDAEWADAIVFGTPTRFGNSSAELKAYIDSLGGLWFTGALNGKVGSVFASSSATHGGNEATLLSLFIPLAHLGLIIVPLGYADPVMFKAGTPYGASAVSGQSATPPTADDLEVARFQGRRVTRVAQALACRHCSK
jgi:NAD(P)H dehydrogenase (quinone)